MRAEGAKMPEIAAIDPKSLLPDDIIRGRCRRWWEACASITGRDGQTIRQPRMNSLQRQVDDAVEWCELEDQPIRVIVLKPRKEGATTWLTGKSYHLLRQSKALLLQIGDQYQTTQTMLDMLRHYQRTDSFDMWPNRNTRLTTDAKNGNGEWSHGSASWTDTAGDRRAGMGKTPTIVHAEEVAHWRNAVEVMLSLLQAVADEPSTYIFCASTANGVGNWFHSTYSGAVTLAERKKGNVGNGWIKVFSAWHESQWSHRPVTPEQGEAIKATLTSRERRGMSLYGWTTDQIAWRRHTITSRCNGSETSFDQEYPEDEKSAFLVSGSPRFDTDGVTKILAAAKEHDDQYGTLEAQPGGKVTWLTDPTGWVWLRERPIPGGRYIAFADPMTGEQSEGSRKRDTHACGILRDSYIDAHGMHAAELVACIHGTGPHGEPGECRWDMDVLVERFYRLVRWYGDCMVIPEANNAGVEFIRLGRQAGMTIWRREKFDKTKPGQTVSIFGFQTSSATRHHWVDTCASYVREQNLSVRYKPAADQFATFVTNQHGDGKAMEGCFDDFIAGIGMGLILLQSGNAHAYMPHQAGQAAVNPLGTSQVGYSASFEGAGRHGACS